MGRKKKIQEPVLPKTSALKRYETIVIEVETENGYGCVHLEINHWAKKFTIVQEHEEGVRFDKDTIESAEAKALAVIKAVEYIKANTQW